MHTPIIGIKKLRFIRFGDVGMGEHHLVRSGVGEQFSAGDADRRAGSSVGIERAEDFQVEAVADDLCSWLNVKEDPSGTVMSPTKVYGLFSAFHTPSIMLAA